MVPSCAKTFSVEAITLTHQQDGRTEALTDNYQKLWIEGAHDPNQSAVAEITAIEGEALLGHLDLAATRQAI